MSFELLFNNKQTKKPRSNALITDLYQTADMTKWKDWQACVKMGQNSE